MLAEILRRSLRLFALVPGLALLGGHLAAQEREVVSKQIGISRSEASLRLEFERGAPLEVALEDGSIRVNGDEIGSYTPELDASWRALLAGVVTLEDGPLARALRDWSPPAGMEGPAAELAGRLEDALEQALGETSLAASGPDGDGARERRALAQLLERADLLADLGLAVEDAQLGEDVRLYVGESAEVPAGVQLDATLVVVDGDLTVRGRVEGDVVVVNGSLTLESGGRVGGDVRSLDGRIEREGGEIAGQVIDLADRRSRTLGEEAQERIRQEVLSELRSDLDQDEEVSFMDRLFSPVRYVLRGIAAVVSTLLTILVLSAVGGVVLHFGRNHLEVVADAARRSPARSAAVGLAGTFLAAPVWLLGALGLVISIVGIPFALIWLPLFPVGLALAAVLGYYAVARNVGGWIARREYPYLGWVRHSNPYTLISAGVLGLLGAFVVSSALAIGGPLLGFLRVLFLVGGILVTCAAVLVGLGAVLITRGGRRPEYWPATDFFEDTRDDLGTAAGESV